MADPKWPHSPGLVYQPLSGSNKCYVHTLNGNHCVWIKIKIKSTIRIKILEAKKFDVSANSIV